MDGSSPAPMDVFSDISQQRKVAKRPDNRKRLANVEAREHPRHLSTIDLRTAYLERSNSSTFNEIEDLFAVLLTHGVTEDGAQQPDVSAHRFSRLATELGSLDGADWLERGIRNVDHASQYRLPPRPAPVIGCVFGKLLVMEFALQITLVITSVLVVLLVLLHRAKGGGLSTLFGGGVQSSLSGSTVVEKNLDRLTLFIIGIWLVSIIGVALLIKYRLTGQ